MTEDISPLWLSFIEACVHGAEAVLTAFERVSGSAEPDLHEPAMHEVLTGLLGHQVYLFTLMGADPNLWHPTLGGIVTRAMTESLINMRWISTQGSPAAERFQEFSLGRRKLLAMHIERLVASGALRDDWQQHADELRSVVDSGKWGDFVDIDLGTWNGKSVRDTATRVGMKVEYDLVYAPGSAAVHVEWAHLQDTVLQRCRELLHRGHWVPRPVGGRSPHPLFAQQAARLVAQSFEVWSTTLNGAPADLDAALGELERAADALAQDFFKKSADARKPEPGSEPSEPTERT